MDATLKKVKELNEKEAPEFEPYKHLYAARSILEESIKEYDTKLKNDTLTSDDKESLQTDVIILKHHLGINYNDTEQRSQATPILSEVVSYLTSSLSLRMRHIVILMKSINYLAIIWSSMHEENKSKKYLDQNEQLYKECHSNDNISMISKSDLNALESEYTHTLFYMAQLYKNLNQTTKSAMCCHKTLQRQIKYQNDSNRLNCKEWVENALGLASFYTNNERFRQSIHCIEAAIKISEYIQSASTNNSDDEKDEDLGDEMNIFEDDEEEKKLKADIARTWGFLYAEILRKSYDIVSNFKAVQDTNSEEKALADTQKLIALDAKLQIDNELIMFEDIELSEPPKMQLASTYLEAKELFIPALNHNMNALKFYILNGFVTDHAKICEMVSNIYKYLAYFEEDKSTKCKLHKRRINLLKPIEAEISVNAYQDIVQSLCYELGSIYENMGSLKKEIFDEQQKEKKKEKNEKMDGTELKQIKKINDLYSKGIHYLSKYVHIFEFPPNAESNEMQPIPEQYHFEYFQAHFLMAALYGKLMGGNKNMNVENIKKSLHGYEHVVQFYQENGPLDGCKVQFGIAKEMKDLLPLKLNTISQ